MRSLTHTVLEVHIQGYRPIQRPVMSEVKTPSQTQALSPCLLGDILTELTLPSTSHRNSS